MRPVRLLQSGSVVIIGNDALHASLSQQPFTAGHTLKSLIAHCYDLSSPAYSPALFTVPVEQHRTFRRLLFTADSSERCLQAVIPELFHVKHHTECFT